ncbi:unnamed protein product [Paramecium sonneborni]|uniref:Uncharacterized protein n=1 Tax=Paramecium sonneborni TaxID=65129 RepID=A0A8S1MBQ6_9CILI|nr:unnamed protein product [Paramecium sonneborni]
MRYIKKQIYANTQYQQNEEIDNNLMNLQKQNMLFFVQKENMKKQI